MLGQLAPLCGMGAPGAGAGAVDADGVVVDVLPPEPLV
jgi:hypothetical protein